MPRFDSIRRVAAFDPLQTFDRRRLVRSLNPHGLPLACIKPIVRTPGWVEGSGHYGAAGDIQDDAGNPARLIGGEKERGLSNVLRCAEPVQGMRGGE